MNDSKSIDSTLSICQAAKETWDVVVLGGGIAGSAIGIHLARRGLSVLIVESKRFPREKVCGGCLNARSQHFLETLGILPERLPTDAPVIKELHIRLRNHVSRWQVPNMLSVRRSTLDITLLHQALDSGAHCVMETRGQVSQQTSRSPHHHRIDLIPVDPSCSTKTAVSIDARRVVVAAGLSRSPLAMDKTWDVKIAKGSRIGCHCLLESDAQEQFSIEMDQVLHMLVGSSGYIGVCRTDGGFLDLAAALDPVAVRAHGGIAPCIQSLLAETGVRLSSQMEHASWEGTPWLTRSSWPAARNGIFLVGDSLGYIEPFTGEGMSWAMAGSEALAGILFKSEREEEQWNEWVARHRRWSQSIAKWVSRQARRPTWARVLLTGLDWLPMLRKRILKKAMQ